MTTVLGPREIYSIRGDMCYDNKIMMNATLPERSFQQTTLNMTETDPNATKQSWTMRKFKSYLRAPHFIDLAIWIIVTILIGLIEYGIVPNSQLGFTCKDPAISYPFRGDTVTATILLTTAGLGSLSIITLVEILRERSVKKVCIGVVWHYYKECLIGVTLVLLITEVIKSIVGEQRPHFLDTCEPDVSQFCRAGDFILDYNCTNPQLTKYTRSDITKSFPSGHSSISFFIAIYCSYLIQVRLRTAQVTQFTKPFLIAICVTWSMVCSLTRIADRRHHWWDVLAGLVLGLCGALYTLTLLRKKDKINDLVRTNTSTTLLDVKSNKQTPQSVII